MKDHLLPALRLLAVMVFLTGFAYPLTVTAIAQLAFPWQAGGSLLVVEEAGQAVAIGSDLIGQYSDSPAYFWSRPSATEPVPYNAAASAGFNRASTSPVLVEAVSERLERLRAAGSLKTGVPVDLVTASASGLDPHISVAAALYQAPRVAAARGLDEDTLAALIAEVAEQRQFGVLGEPRVNVLRLNLRLDRLQP